MNRKWLSAIFEVIAGMVLAAVVSAQPLPPDEDLPPKDFVMPGGDINAPRRGEMRQRQQGNPYAQYYEQQRRQQYLMAIRENDPQRFQRIMKIRDLANQYRQSNDPARKAEIEKQLRPLLDEELRAQQNDAKDRVARMEKRLDNIKKLLKQRDDHWNEVVDFNLKKITGQNDYLDFRFAPEPAPSTPGGPGPRDNKK
jgi:hypothetical protein